MDPRSRSRPWLALVLLATFAAYAPSLGNGFAQDDVYLVQVAGNVYQPNAQVAEWQGFWTYFGSHYGASQWATGAGYRPITVISYAATYALCGGHVFEEAFPHHLLNVLMHVLGTWLVFRLLRVLRVPPLACLAGAAVFGLHALRTEAVAGIVGRAELLAFAAGAAALLVWHGTGAAPGRWRWLAGVLLFVAFCSKESALAWVPFMPLFAIAAGQAPGRSVRAALRHAALPLVAFFVLRTIALAGLPTALPIAWLANPLAAEPAAARIATALLLSVRGLWQTLVPLDLCSDYGPHTLSLAHGFGEGRVLGALALIVGLLALGISCWRRQPLLFLAVASFFGFSFLTSNVPFATGTIHAERLYYAPALGLTFAAAALVGRWPRTAWLVLAWLAASLVVTVTRAPVWRDDLTLFRTDSQRNPRSVRLLTAYAKAVSDQGPEHQTEAMALLRRALELEPELATSWNELARLLIVQSQRPEVAEPARRDLMRQAESALRRGLESRHAVPEQEVWRAHAILGGVHLRQDQLDAAEPLLVSAVTRMPRHLQAWLDLGELGDRLAGRGEKERARAIFARMAASPDLPDEVRRNASARLR